MGIKANYVRACPVGCFASVLRTNVSNADVAMILVGVSLTIKFHNEKILSETIIALKNIRGKPHLIEPLSGKFWG
jgi:hypothetical protein